MAYSKKKTSGTEITKDGNYEAWSGKHQLKDEKAFKAMAKVRNAYERSRSYLQSSCFWDSYQEASTGVTINGGSWYSRWNLQEKMALMWYFPPNSDDFVSNIKSPMSRGRINTFVNWMKKVNIEIGAKPNNKADRNAAIMANKLVNYWIKNSNALGVLGDAWEDLATHGNSYLKVSYVREMKNFRFPKTTDLTEDEDKEVKEGKKKVLYSDVQEHYITDDVVMEHVPIREIFPDPSARNLHGDTYRAGWIIRKRYVTLDYIKAIYSDHPNVKYLDKVKGAASYRDDTEYFFQPPKDMMADDIVELLEMEDADNDCYYVIANDIPLLGIDDEEPLPFNHKELSYHKLDFIRVPGQYFSIGICDLLDNIQASYEVALNMVAEYVYRTYNYKLLVESDNYGEIKQAVARSGDLFVPIDTSDGKPLNTKVMPLQVSPIGFDIFQFLQLLEKNATLATNIDPAQMALLSSSKTATSDILNRELLMTMIGGVMQNNINGDLRAAFRQVWKLQQQFYTKPRVKKTIGDKGEKEYKRTIRFDGIELMINPDTSLLVEKDIEGDYSFFEITDKYLSTKDEVDVFIKPESVEISSQAMDEKKMKEEFAQLIPFAVDANNAQQIAMHQMPMVDATKLFQEYFYVNRLPDYLLLNKSKTNDKAIANAEKHVMAILNGEDGEAQAVPGQSAAHLEYEYSVLDALTVERDHLLEQLKKDLENKAEKIMQQMKGIPPFDPMTGQPIQMPQPQPDARIVSDLENIEEKMVKLQKHVMIESMPASMRNSRVMMMQQEQQPPMTPPGSPMGMPPSEMEAPMPKNSMAPSISPDMMSGMNPQGQVPMGAPMAGPGNLPVPPMQ